jgi:hypothetical protein
MGREEVVVAPANKYLEDEGVRTRLREKHPRLIYKTTIESEPGVEEVHWDFKGAVEGELLDGYVDDFADPDFRTGHVTLEGAVLGTYGYSDESVVKRMQNHFVPWSPWNKSRPNGQVCIIDTDGTTIVRGDRRALSVAYKTGESLKDSVTAVKVFDRLGRRRELVNKRALKIDPSAGPELEQIDQTQRREIEGHKYFGNGD